MKKHIDGEKLIAAIKTMMEDADGPKVPPRSHFENMPEQGPAPKKTPTLADAEALAADIAGSGRITAEQLEKIYREIKKRLLDELPEDPIFIQLLATRPEMVVELQPRIVTLDGSTMKGRVARLLASGWFDQPKPVFTTRKELARIGTDPGGGGQLSDAIKALVKDGFLTGEGNGYQKAPGVKITEKVLEAVR